MLTLPELAAKEQAFWQQVTPVGVVFDIGMVMGFIVGTAICYQVLFSEISDRLARVRDPQGDGLHEPVALPGRGLPRRSSSPCSATALGLALSQLAFRAIHESTGLPMMLKPGDGLKILALTLVMCTLSGILAARKLIAVDPAELYG